MIRKHDLPQAASDILLCATSQARRSVAWYESLPLGRHHPPASWLVGVHTHLEIINRLSQEVTANVEMSRDPLARVYLRRMERAYYDLVEYHREAVDTYNLF